MVQHVSSQLPMRPKKDKTDLTFCEIHQWNTLGFRGAEPVGLDIEFMLESGRTLLAPAQEKKGEGDI